MAHLWIPEQQAVGNGEPTWNEWALLPLEGGAVALGPDEGRPARRGGAALLVRSRSAAGEVWFAMCATPAGVHLNGVPLPAGIRALTERDELRVDGWGRVFFSIERLARVEPFPGSERPVRCPRCKLEIAAGAPAVRCPQCTVWHHQSDEFLCWTYAEHCALCPQMTALDAGYRWTPEGL